MRLRGGDVARDRRRPRSARTGASRSTAWCAGRSPRPRRPRGVGRHAGHGRRRDLRQRAFSRPPDQRARRRRDARRRATARVDDVPGSGDGVRLRLQPAAADARDRRLGGLPCRPGEPAALRAVARESLAFRKRTQPLASPSAGCIFQNPDPAREQVPDGIPSSAGALVDRAGLKGARKGGAAFRRRTATSSSTRAARRQTEIRALIERCKDGVREAFRCGAARRNRLPGIRS